MSWTLKSCTRNGVCDPEASLICFKKKISTPPSPWLGCSATQSCHYVTPCPWLRDWWLCDCTRISSSSCVFPRLHLCTCTQGRCLFATFYHSWGLFCSCCPTTFALITIYFPLFPKTGSEHCPSPPHILSAFLSLFLALCLLKHPALWLRSEKPVTGCAMVLRNQWAAGMSHSRGLPTSVHAYQNKWNCDEEGICLLTSAKG